MIALTTDFATRPTRAETYAAAVIVAQALGQRIAFTYQGVYHFRLGDGWSIALSAEDAGRFRIQACRWTEPAATLWALAADHERLADLAIDMADEVEDARLRA